MIKTKLWLGVMAAFLIAFPSRIYAYTLDYWTYDGFSPIVTAFQKIALIFSDTGYGPLLFVLAVLGMVFGAAGLYFKAVLGGPFHPLAWFWPVLVGIVLYESFVLPKGTVNIYDAGTNETMTVGGIPDGIVALAGGLNLIERQLVDIISTSATPGSYQSSAGGKGLDIMLKSSGSQLHFIDMNVDNSVNNYFKDCVLFELVRPGTTLTINSLSSTNSLLTTIAAAANPAIFTVWHDNTNPTGISMDCAAVYTKLSTLLTPPAAVANMQSDVCYNIGYKSGIAVEQTHCNQLLTDYVGMASGNAALTGPVFLQQSYLAESLNNVITQANPNLAITALSNKNLMASGIGTGIVANEWIPCIRAVVTAVAIGMTPIIVLFLPTPLVGKALGLLFGFFVWLTAWGVTDAIAHGVATDYAVNSYGALQQYGIGFTSMMMWPSASMKALSMFGLIRSAGIMLATVLTVMIVKFGGSAMSMMANNLSGTMQSQGGAAGSGVLTPEGATQNVRAMSQAAGTVEWVNPNSHHGGFKFNARAEGAAIGMENQTASGLATMQNYNALTENRRIPQETPFQDFLTASHASGSIATEEGLLQYSSTPSGGLTKTAMASGHTSTIASPDPGNPTTNFPTTNLGIFGPKIRDSVQGASEKSVSEAAKMTESAGQEYGEAVTAAVGNENSFIKTIQNSEGFSRDEKKAFGENFKLADKLTDGVVHDLVNKTGMKEDEARKVATETSLAMGIGGGGKGGPLPLQILSKITGFKAEANRTGSSSETDQLDKVQEVMESGGYKQLHDAALIRESTIQAATNTAHQKGIKSVVDGGEGHKASLNNAKTTREKLQNANQRELAVGETTKYMESQGLISDTNLAPMVYEELKSKNGEQEAQRIVSAGSNGTATGEDLHKINEAINTVGDRFSSGIKERADKVAGIRSTILPLINKNLESARDKNMESPQEYFSAMSSDIDRLRKEGEVQEGAVIPVVSGKLSKGEMQMLENDYHVKVQEFSPKELEQAKKDLEGNYNMNKESWGVFGAGQAFLGMGLKKTGNEKPGPVIPAAVNGKKAN